MGDFDLAERPTVRQAETSEPNWTLVDLSDGPALPRLAAKMRASLSPEHVEQDPEWQVLHCDPGDQMVALVDQDNTGLYGVLSGRIHGSRIAFEIAGMTLARKRLRVMTVHTGIVTRRREAPAAISRALVAAAKLIPGSPALFLDAVPEGSTLHGLLTTTGTEIHRAYRVLPWAETGNARATWTGSVEEYLKAIGKGTRKDLKRCAKELMSDPARDCKVRSFSTPAELEEFLADGVAISDKTYQKKHLHLGLSTGGKLEAQLRFAAGRGAFLGHILYVDRVPIAFQYGFIYGDKYFAQQVGHDPDWKDVQPGSVLHLEVLRDIECRKLDVKVLDFGQGMTKFKERTTNEHRIIGHYYLFPRTPKGFALYLVAGSMSGTKRFLQWTIDALRLRDTVKSLLQRWTGRGHMQ